MKQLLVEEQKPYFFDEDKRWELEIKRYINDKDLLSHNNKTLGDYYNFLMSQGHRMRTIHNNIKYVNYFLKYIKKPISKIKNKDVMNYAGYVNQETPNSFNMYMSGVNLFFTRFLKNKRIVEDIKWRKVKGNGKLPEALISPEEIEKIISKCDNTRDKALIMVMYDTGIRVGELINAKIKNIKEDEYGIKIMFDGKTGMRQLRLTSSTPFLKEWLNNHPYKNDLESPIFVNQSHGFYGKIVRVHGMNRILKRCAKRAGITKNIHCHLLRHSRLTELSKDYTEQELKIIAGWVGDSTMPRVYIHLSGEDIDKKILIKNGLLKDKEVKIEEDKKKLLQPKICPDPSCKYQNSYSNKYCSNCHRPLDILTLIKQEEELKKLDKVKGYNLQYLNRNENINFKDFLKKKIVEDLKQEIIEELKQDMEKENIK